MPLFSTFLLTGTKTGQNGATAFVPLTFPNTDDQLWKVNSNNYIITHLTLNMPMHILWNTWNFFDLMCHPVHYVIVVKQSQWWWWIIKTNPIVERSLQCLEVFSWCRGLSIWCVWLHTEFCLVFFSFLYVVISFNMSSSILPHCWWFLRGPCYKEHSCLLVACYLATT